MNTTRIDLQCLNFLKQYYSSQQLSLQYEKYTPQTTPMGILTLGRFLSSCNKCVKCEDCQGNNNYQGGKVCQKDFSSKPEYDNYIKDLETKGGCKCH
jgi:hypothetical protein